MRNHLLYTIGTCAIISCWLSGCHNDEQVVIPPRQQASNDQVKEGLIKSNQMYIKQEADEIAQYIKRHNYDMQSTKTGISYMVSEHGKGEQPAIGDIAKVSYSISLMDGTVCYDSKTDGPKEFRVGQDAVETGVHEAIQLMHVGDKATFIIPSYEANGLVGDKDRIPPGAVVIYDINLLSVKKAAAKASSK